LKGLDFICEGYGLHPYIKSRIMSRASALEGILAGKMNLIRASLEKILKSLQRDAIFMSDQNGRPFSLGWLFVF
jgi:hypothetical protein